MLVDYWFTLFCCFVSLCLFELVLDHVTGSSGSCVVVVVVIIIVVVVTVIIIVVAMIIAIERTDQFGKCDRSGARIQPRTGEESFQQNSNRSCSKSYAERHSS